MRSSLLLSSAVLLLSAASAAAQTPPPSTFSDSADVVVVEVPVQVLRDGEPVLGLASKDFDVYEGHRKLPITGFEVARPERGRPGPRRAVEDGAGDLGPAPLPAPLRPGLLLAQGPLSGAGGGPRYARRSPSLRPGVGRRLSPLRGAAAPARLHHGPPAGPPGPGDAGEAADVRTGGRPPAARAQQGRH